MSDAAPIDFITLTADIVSAHVAHNAVHASELPTLITTVYSALNRLTAPVPDAIPEKPKGATSARASIKPGYLISMIDGKPYKMLRRHITGHGYSPDTYREAFGLPHDYPMIAADYAAERRSLAYKIGLGRRPTAQADAEAPEQG